MWASVDMAAQGKLGLDLVVEFNPGIFWSLSIIMIGALYKLVRQVRKQVPS